MSVQTAVVDKIYKYAEEAESSIQQRDDEDTYVGEVEYEKRLDDTLERLQGQVREHHRALERLRASQSTPLALEPSVEPQERSSQIRLITSAYESLIHAEPDLPLPGSPLPSLIALRQAHEVVRQTKAGVQKLKTDVIRNRRRLEQEESNLNDARLITEAMEQRIERLRVQVTQEEQKSPLQRAQQLIDEQRRRKAELSRDSSVLREALETFIEDHLAAMIAAEDLGGPITGDTVEIEDAMLELGFTSQGKAKKTSKPTKTKTGQQRMDGYLGEDKSAMGRREAAATELTTLLEELLEAYQEGNSYVELKRDSAAVRFLVRAKVAHFHPRDARRLRLVDFGREIGV